MGWGVVSCLGFSTSKLLVGILQFSGADQNRRLVCSQMILGVRLGEKEQGLQHRVKQTKCSYNLGQAHPAIIKLKIWCNRQHFEGSLQCV